MGTREKRQLYKNTVIKLLLFGYHFTFSDEDRIAYILGNLGFCFFLFTRKVIALEIKQFSADNIHCYIAGVFPATARPFIG